MPPKARKTNKKTVEKATKNKQKKSTKATKDKEIKQVEIKTEPGLSTPQRKRPPVSFELFLESPDKKKSPSKTQLTPEQQRMIEKLSQPNRNNIILYTPQTISGSNFNKMQKYPFFITFGKPGEPFWSMKMDYARDAAKVVMQPNPEYEELYDSLTSVPWRKNPQGPNVAKMSIKKGVETKYKIFIAYGFIEMHPEQKTMFNSSEDQAIAFAEHFLSIIKKNEFEEACRTLLKAARMSDAIYDDLSGLIEEILTASVVHKKFDALDNMVTNEDVYRMCWYMFEDEYKNDSDWTNDMIKLAFKSGEMPDL